MKITTKDKLKYLEIVYGNQCIESAEIGKYIKYNNPVEITLNEDSIKVFNKFIKELTADTMKKKYESKGLTGYDSNYSSIVLELDQTAVLKYLKNKYFLKK